MSTRSILAFETEMGVRGVYVHTDGYPEGEWGRLNQLSILIARDGVSKVATTVLEHSHWSCLFAEQVTKPEYSPEHETLVVGYGMYFEHDAGDRYFTPDQLQDWWDSEYVYLVNPEGEVKWVALGVGHDDLTWESLQWRTDAPEEAVR